MKDYKIFELSDNVTVDLIGTTDIYGPYFPLFKVSRKSISMGIFESKLAEAAKVDMQNGNVYELRTDIKDEIFVVCDGEYAFFTPRVVHL